MIRRVLVGLNGSECTAAAMEYAIALAAKHGASLVGVGVVDEPQLAAPESVPLGAGAFKQERDAAVVHTAHTTIDQVLAEFYRRCEGSAVYPATDKRVGDPVQVLARESQKCDLLVVGKRPFIDDEWARSGRTLGSLLRHSPRPVLCVPEVRNNETPVLVAYDGSLQAARTLQAFVESGLNANREIHVASLGSQADENAALAKEFLNAHMVSPRLIVEVSSADVVTRLLSIAQQLQAGLIVLGCYGQPQLKEFFFGSATRGILAQSSVPLFLYH